MRVTVAERLVSAAGLVGRWLAPAGSKRPSGWMHGFHARQRATESWLEFGRARERGPLVWLHGASAGELLGAAPVIEALRTRRSFQLAVSHGSPSGRHALPALGPDAADYPSLDRVRDCEAVVEAVRPDLCVFAKADLWPGMIGAMRRAGVPVALVNGTVRPGSTRLRPWARSLFASMYRSLDACAAVSEADARRLVRLGAPVSVVKVVGDGAYDACLQRVERARIDGDVRELLERLPPRPAEGVRVVAGSTWPEDDTALLSAIGALARGAPGQWQWVIAPHELDGRQIAGFLEGVRAIGLRSARISQPAETDARSDAPDVIVWDEIGALAELYTTGDIGYVGGGLAGRGLHNVLEPAAAGLPVLFGGRHDRADAEALAEAGGGLPIIAPDQLPAAFRALGPASADSRRQMAERARAFVVARAGAADRTAAWLDALWD